MIDTQHVDEPPGGRTGVNSLGPAAQLLDHRFSRWGRAGDAQNIERRVVDQPEVRAPLTNRQVFGQMAVRAEGLDAQLSDCRLVADTGGLGDAQIELGARIVRGRAVPAFLRALASWQSARRVGETGIAAVRSRIERANLDLVAAAEKMRKDAQDAVGFEIERPTAVRNEMIFVLVRTDRNPVGGHFEEIDGRCRVERKERRLRDRRQPRIDLIEGEQNVDASGSNFRKHFVETIECESEELAREEEILPQKIEAAEHARVVREERLVGVESELFQTVLRRSNDNRVPERIEVPEIDAGTIREELFVEGNRIGLGAYQVQWKFGRTATCKPEFRRLRLSRAGDLILDPCCPPVRQRES
jgi:hypothetical protein